MSRYHAPLRWGLGHGGLGPAGGGRSSAIWQRTIIMMTVLAAAAGSVLPGSVAGGGARRRAAPVRWAMRKEHRMLCQWGSAAPCQCDPMDGNSDHDDSADLGLQLIEVASERLRRLRETNLT